MRRYCPGAALAVAFFAAFAAAPAETPVPVQRLRLSISSSLFQGMPEPLVVASMRPFESLLISQIGMGCDMVLTGCGAAVARHLMDGSIQIGVVEGIEYAWMKQRHPQLRHLMIAVNMEQYPQSCLIVRKGSGI